MTCARPHSRVYSEHYSAYAGCASARPPGADTRRPPPPPPWRGSSLFVGKFVPSPALCSVTSVVGRCCRAASQSTFIHRRDFIHSSRRTRWRRVGAVGHTVGCMSTSSGILALVVRRRAARDVDRIAAAAGVRVVHADEPSSRKVWTGGVGGRARRRRRPPVRGARGLPRTGRVFLVGRADSSRTPSDWQRRDRRWRATGAVPARAGGELVAELSDAADSASDGRSTRRGASRSSADAVARGASVFATALAQCRVAGPAGGRRSVGRRHRPGAGQ